MQEVQLKHIEYTRGMQKVRLKHTESTQETKNMQKVDFDVTIHTTWVHYNMEKDFAKITFPIRANYWDKYTWLDLPIGI